MRLAMFALGLAVVFALAFGVGSAGAPVHRPSAPTATTEGSHDHHG